MMDFVNSFKSLVKIEQIRTDNNVFRLHYKFTVIMLIVFSILLTSKQFFGDPIVCETGAMNREFMQLYCWINGTYIIKESLTSKNNHHINDHISGLGTLGTGRTLIWQRYYQWVCIVFFFQALLFYVPRYLWKSWEGGRLGMLVNELMGPFLPPASTWNLANKTKLINWLLSARYLHNFYALRYMVCEFLNFFNVLGQIFLLDWLLDGRFATYGLSVLLGEGAISMSHVFPKVVKCAYHNFGPSGTKQDIDSLCVLSLNVLNEKLFLILWFWFFFLLLVTALSLLYRALVLLVPRLRVYLLMAQARDVGAKQVALIVRQIGYGDFFLLYHVGKNMNAMAFRELVLALYETLNRKTSFVESNTI